MLWLFVIGITFSTVFIAEFGDKSQLMTISLASRYDNKAVFAGIFAGIVIITTLAVAFGTILFQLIPILYVKLLASMIFISFGIYTIFYEKNMDRDIEKKNDRVIWSSFLFSIFAELGDKTQLAVIALTARYALPLSVLTGALIGMAAVIGISVILGSKLGCFLENKKLDLIAGLLFIGLGSIFLFEALFFG